MIVTKLFLEEGKSALGELEMEGWGYSGEGRVATFEDHEGGCAGKLGGGV